MEQENHAKNVQNKYKNTSYNERKTEQAVLNTRCFSATQKKKKKTKKTLKKKKRLKKKKQFWVNSLIFEFKKENLQASR